MSTKNKDAWLLESIVENLPMMVFLKEATELRFELWNKAGVDLVGFTREDLLGKNDFDFFPREQAEFFTKNDREVLSNRKTVSVEEPIKTKHGDRWLITRKVPLIDEDGVPRYLLGISLDITERRKIEQDLKETLEQLISVEPLVQRGRRAEEIGREITSALDAGDIAKVRELAKELSEGNDDPQ
jgi:two-component system cell cycle sensor histidine kinase/response regulator CckA